MTNPRNPLPLYGLLAAATAALAWAYWPTLRDMVHRWTNEPQYSHGYLVPLFSLYLLWFRRESLQKLTLSPSWWGLLFLAIGGALRLGAARYYFDFADGLSLLPTLAGIALLLGGWPALRWSWPAIAFLGFMLPLPFSVETKLAHPLQRVATLASTYTLQTIGLAALSEGNVIWISDRPLNVAEACSGLRMLMTFFALSTGFVIVIQRPWLDKLVFMLSAVPIALLTNVIRITVTGILYQLVDSQWAESFFHDYAGYLMPVLAIGMLAAEMWVLDHLLLPQEEARMMTRGLPSGSKDAAVSSQPQSGVPVTG